MGVSASEREHAAKIRGESMLEGSDQETRDERTGRQISVGIRCCYSKRTGISSFPLSDRRERETCTVLLRNSSSFFCTSKGTRKVSDAAAGIARQAAENAVDHVDCVQEQPGCVQLVIVIVRVVTASIRCLQASVDRLMSVITRF